MNKHQDEVCPKCHYRYLDVSSVLCPECGETRPEPYSEYANFTKKRFFISGIWGFLVFLILQKSEASFSNGLFFLLAPTFAVPWIYFLFVDSEEGKINSEQIVLVTIAGFFICMITGFIPMGLMIYILDFFGTDLKKFLDFN